MKSELILKVFLFISVIITLLLFYSVLTFPGFILFNSGSHYFCVSKGYDSNSWDGAFSEKFGKVKCVSCYNMECIYEEFNVTRDWTGRLKLKQEMEDEN